VWNKRGFLNGLRRCQQMIACTFVFLGVWKWVATGENSWFGSGYNDRSSPGCFDLGTLFGSIGVAG
jgi:hypothetical protein